jgi:hypothetical protein
MDPLPLAAMGRRIERPMIQRIDDVLAESKAKETGTATPAQVKTIYALLRRRNLPVPTYDLALLPYGHAVAIITELTRP